MNRQELVKHMAKELDWYAKEYLKYTDAEVKESLAEDFKKVVSAYNGLYKSIFNEGCTLIFRRKIEKYIEEREYENWV